MTTDLRLLSELNDLQDSRVHEWLKERQRTAVNGMAFGVDNEERNIAAGRYRELDDIIKEVETAKEKFEQQRKKANIDPNKRF